MYCLSVYFRNHKMDNPIIFFVSSFLSLNFNVWKKFLALLLMLLLL